VETMTTRERIRATIKREPVDRLSLCVDTFCHGGMTFLDRRYPDPFEHARYLMGLGLDTGIELSYPLGDLPDSIAVRQWREERSGAYPLLYKEYATPRGNLRQVVRQTPDYPQEINLASDHNVPPTRSKEYLVSAAEDLDKLECMFGSLNNRAVESYRQQARQARTFCDKHQLTLAAYSWGVGDPLIWFSGIEGVLMMAMTEKEMLSRYVAIMADWHRKTMEVAIDAGVDHFLRRGWYESTDFWSPWLYEEFLLGPLKREVELAHQAGCTFGYVMASGATPLLSYIREAGVDIYSNIDPLAPNTDLRHIRDEIGDSVTLCGGLNNYETLEQKPADEVRRAVLEAIEILTPPAGCILAPADSLYLGDPATIERNFHVMVDTWKEAVW